MSSKLHLSDRAFWDVDFASLNYDRDKNFIIRKAFDRGSWNDMKWCVDFYGEEQVKETLVNAPYLRNEVVRLCSVLFNVQPESFRCYMRKLQMPIPGGF